MVEKNFETMDFRENHLATLIFGVALAKESRSGVASLNPRKRDHGRFPIQLRVNKIRNNSRTKALIEKLKEMRFK